MSIYYSYHYFLKSYYRLVHTSKYPRKRMTAESRILQPLRFCGSDERCLEVMLSCLKVSGACHKKLYLWFVSVLIAHIQNTSTLVNLCGHFNEWCLSGGGEKRALPENGGQKPQGLRESCFPWYGRAVSKGRIPSQPLSFLSHTHRSQNTAHFLFTPWKRLLCLP